MQTNRTSARIFPAVPDVENPEFKVKLDHLVELNQQLIAIGESDAPAAVKNLQRVPLIAAFVSDLLAMYLMKPIDSGSVDFSAEPQLVY
jgi:magnesium-protoporphyrin IX monomethyl ester (oxidative) cyclase